MASYYTNRFATYAIVAVALTAGTLLAAACGGGDNGGDDGADASPAATATLDAEPTSADAEDTPASDPAIELNACDLVSEQDIEAAIGAPVGEGTPEQAANLFTCSYADPEFPAFSIAGVAVLVADNNDDAKEIYELAKSNAAGVQEVNGVGEAAYWDDVLASMQIVDGRYEVSVDVASEEGRDQVGAATTIAQKALAALP